jgi:hypothetical protein
MVQLVENGIIGSIIFLLFILSFERTVHGISDIRFRMLAMGWMLCVLFVSLTSWVYDMPQFFIVFGLIIGLQKHLSCNRK